VHSFSCAAGSATSKGYASAHRELAVTHLQGCFHVALLGRGVSAWAWSHAVRACVAPCVIPWEE
jgi:hypothetical protein